MGVALRDPSPAAAAGDGRGDVGAGGGALLAAVPTVGAGLVPTRKKKVPKGSVFTLKGETVRFCMSERLFEAFTLSKEMGCTFGRTRGQTFSKATRFEKLRKVEEGYGAPHTYDPSTAAVVASAGRTSRATTIHTPRTLPRHAKGRETRHPAVGQYSHDHLFACRTSHYRTRRGRFSTLPKDKHTQVQKVVEAPGPQDYQDIGFTPAPPQWSQAATPRFPEPPYRSPGPCAYGPHPHARRPQSAHIARAQTAHITHTAVNLRREAFSPGPGTYRRERLFDRSGTEPAVATRWVAECNGANVRQSSPRHIKKP